MGSEDTRQSDRIHIELAIIITGTDIAGRQFTEEIRTLVVSRRGAKIVSRQALVPQQILKIQCLRTGLEADARVVGPIEGAKEGCEYGIALLHPEVNLWGIGFPDLVGTDPAAGRVFLECTRCRSQEVTHLDAFELEVLVVNNGLLSPCAQCNGTTLWIRPAPESDRLLKSREPPGLRRPVEGKGPPVLLDAAALRRREALTPPPPRDSVQKRREPRVSLGVDICIRHPVFGEEIVTTENVSRGGFRFRSRKDYSVATVIEAALPYVPGAANIFAPARIVYKGDPGPDGTTAFGVAYIPTQLAKSLTGMRIFRPT